MFLSLIRFNIREKYQIQSLSNFEHSAGTHEIVFFHPFTMVDSTRRSIGGTDDALGCATLRRDRSERKAGKLFPYKLAGLVPPERIFGRAHIVCADVHIGLLSPRNKRE